MAFTEQSYLGSGRVFTGGLEVGNVPELTLEIDEEVIELQDSTSPGGGIRNTVRRINTVQIVMKRTDFNTENLAQAYLGSSSSTASSPLVDESIAAPAVLTTDTLVETANMIDIAVAPVVTSDPAGTTYDINVDYEVVAAGIIILASGSIGATTALLVSYTSEDFDVIEAITGSTIDRRFVFTGLNEAQSDKPVIIVAHKVKFGAAASSSYIGADFGEFDVTGDVLKDTSIVGANLSKFFQVKRAA